MPAKTNSSPKQSSQDLFPGRHIYSVSEITGDIKSLLQNAFAQVWVEGEVSNFNKHSSGHFYFSLKDKDALLSAAMFSRANKEVKFKIEDGLKVICFGRIEAYLPRSQYQIIVERIEPKGIGSLQLAFEQLKEKLEKEGLFKTEHKRHIPYLPSRVGVVTSLSGAAIKDILKVLDRRFSDVHVIVSPAMVQGEGAKEEIVEAINKLNNFSQQAPSFERIEVMIVGRGGGSIEDLWAFNEEIVARAIYNSHIPVISAVGHERDMTIADLVADLRAPTPSVAAELVIPKKEELQERLRSISADLKRTFADIALNFYEAIEALNHRLDLSIYNILRLSAQEFGALRKKLTMLNPAALIPQFKEKIENAARQIYVRMQHYLQLKQATLKGSIENLSGLSPLNILARGYSITFKAVDGSILKDAKGIKIGESIKTRLEANELLSRVTDIKQIQ